MGKNKWAKEVEYLKRSNCDSKKVDANRPEANIFHLAKFVYIRKDISGYWQ